MLLGRTDTLPTGAGVTVSAMLPLFVSLVAVIVALPVASAFTTPAVETVATSVLLEVHVTMRSVTTVPFASFTVAVSGVVDPATRLFVAGATVTLPTGTGVTVTVALPDFVSLVAVTVAVPGATPVTTPVVAPTVATAVLLDDHVTARSVTTAPLTSLTVTASVVVVPATRFLLVGATVTLPTGAAETVSAALPDFASLVAVIVAVPGETAVATPLPDTVATAVLLDAQVTARSVTTTPLASFTTAVNDVVCPTVAEAVAGCTTTLPTGTGVTATVDVPVFPSAVALIVAEPGARAVTTPVVETLATAVLLEVQVTGRSVTTVPLASFTVIDNAAVSPTCRLAVGGCIVTLATGTLVTVTAALPLFPSLVAVIVAEPTDTPVTTPVVALTVATAVLFDDQATTRSVTIAPFASFTVAESVVVVPITRLFEAGTTATLPTGTGVTVTVALADLVSLVAVIDALPGATPVTTPFVDTVATALLLDVQVTGRLVTTAPFTSRIVAASVVV